MISDEDYILRSINGHGHFWAKFTPSKYKHYIKSIKKGLKWTPMNNR